MIYGSNSSLPLPPLTKAPNVYCKQTKIFKLRALLELASSKTTSNLMTLITETLGNLLRSLDKNIFKPQSI